MVTQPWFPAVALSGSDYSAVELASDGRRAFVLDQLLLPTSESYRICDRCDEIADAIRSMVVRGAPAIGIAAAYGMVLAAAAAIPLSAAGYRDALRAAADRLLATRPTAVNLKWAVDRCLVLANAHADEVGDARHRAMAALARAIHTADVAACRVMGRAGAARMIAHANSGAITILTHCNAGALATGGYGTALGVVRACAEAGLAVRVIADETRPYLQGARLTAWELARDGIDVTVIADDMAAHCMRRGMIDAIVVGADRIAANGDVANKIGTYGVACLARAHRIPFYVAAPQSTVDPATASGADIPIEERARIELTELGGRCLVPDAARVLNPGFDVTPAELVTAIITELGACEPSAILASRRENTVS
jgi:methylthioribose-1-phosphate isomerase